MIEGALNLDQYFQKMSKAQVKTAITRSIQLVQGAAKFGTPAVTGALRESILTDIEEDGDTVRGTCYTNMKYAPYVEFGTGPKGQGSHAGIAPDVNIAYSQSPWWIHEGPGENEVDRATAERYGWYYIDTPQGRFYRCYGQPAQPFMYPALKNNEEAIVRIIGEDFKKQL